VRSRKSGMHLVQFLSSFSPLIQPCLAQPLKELGHWFGRIGD
jgi:hypothetical protein